MSTKKQSPKAGETRRKFLKKTGTVAAAAAALKVPVYAGNKAPSANVKGANDRIAIGFVGVGGRGFSAHVRQMKEFQEENNISMDAVCDVSSYRVAHAQKYIARDIKMQNQNGQGTKILKANPKVQGYTDYRKLIERKDIDAVVCATVDHWHKRICIDAMDSGKDVYVEKPMTRYLGEAFELYDAVKRTKRKVQVGSQITSCGNFAKAAELVAQGKLGPLVLAQGSYMRNNPKGEWNYRLQPWATKGDIQWATQGGKIGWLREDMKQIDFDPKHYFRWRKYLPYCAGLLGDLVPHRLFPLMRALGKPEFPSRVVCLGSRHVTPDRDVSDNTQVMAEFPSGGALIVTSSSIHGAGFSELIRGHYGTIALSSTGDILEYKPEKPFAEEFDPETYTKLTPSGNATPQHHKNWLDCIRSGAEPVAGIDLAMRVQAVISLAEISERRGTMAHFDPKTRKVTDGAGMEIKPFDYEEEAMLDHGPYGPIKEIGG